MSRKAAVVDVETFDTLDHLENPLNPPRSATGPDIDGDHPDPITLCEPAYDDQGLLRWSSLPPQRP